LTVDIPAELHRRAKVFAASEGKDLREVVMGARDLFLGAQPSKPLRAYLGARPSSKKGGKS
jgi:hypothetical protein